MTCDASQRQLPPSSSSCYYSNVWELQSWTKTPLNSLKWSNKTAPALAALLSLQMDILYLATSNVSIWALIFHGEQLLYLALENGQAKTVPRGNRRRKNLPGQPSHTASQPGWRGGSRGMLEDRGGLLRGEDLWWSSARLRAPGESQQRCGVGPGD